MLNRSFIPFGLLILLCGAATSQVSDMRKRKQGPED